ncbi:hypothetical protein ACFLXP_04430 [Chloroflexota bacterium]
MQYFNESVIRDYGDEVTHRFLDLWHQECLSYLKHDVEVIMIDRFENPQLRKMDGTINTASPGAVIDEKIRLILWLEDINKHPPDPLILTHEVGHWILLLRGYRSVVDPNHISSENVISLNSLAHHPPLFALQRSLGHEPQEMIDSQTENDTNFYNEYKERDSQRWISDALYITDHLISCSENYRHKLNNVLRKRMPNVNRIVRSVVELIKISDLHSPESNEKLCYKLIKELKFQNWIEYDQLLPFQKHLDN